METTIEFTSVDEKELLPERMEWMIVRVKGGDTVPGYLSYNGTWYGAEGETLRGVTHWADFPFIHIKK